MGWIMIDKMNETKINDDMNEMDFSTWNEWDESDQENM